MLSHQIYSVLAGGPNTGTVTETTQEKHTWESVKPTVPLIAKNFINVLFFIFLLNQYYINQDHPLNCIKQMV